MNKQTTISFAIIIIVAIALFFGIRALNTAPQGQVPNSDITATMPTDSDRMMGKMPADTNPPIPSSELAGTTWVWKHNIIGGDAIATPKNPEKFSITFGADGNVSGTTDCNGFGGEYKLASEGIVSFGPFMSTMMYCEGSQEADFTGSLAQATRLTKDTEGNLVVVLGGTSNVMVFEKK